MTLGRFLNKGLSPLCLHVLTSLLRCPSLPCPADEGLFSFQSSFSFPRPPRKNQLFPHLCSGTPHKGPLTPGYRVSLLRLFPSSASTHSLDISWESKLPLYLEEGLAFNGHAIGIDYFSLLTFTFCFSMFSAYFVMTLRYAHNGRGKKTQ